MAPIFIFLCLQVQWCIQTYYAYAGKYITAFDGQVETIRIALKQLLTLEDKLGSVVLPSDLQAAILDIGSAPPPPQFIKRYSPMSRILAEANFVDEKCCVSMNT